jgi:uncharacterized protein (TIGR03435 family)
MIASAKFLVPISLLIGVGERLQLRPAAQVAPPAFSMVMEGLTEPVPVHATIETARPGPSHAAPAAGEHWGAQRRADLFPLLLVGVWGCGSLFLLVRWGNRWRQLRATVLEASPMGLTTAGIPVLSTPMRMEPGIFGIVRPVLLLPRGITDQLTASQLDAILTHELCHVRRRDNLTALLHMVVEALFWFNPAVWLIGAGLIEERERACDEAVLDSSREALVYAEGILNVCKFYVEAPMSCVSGVTGSDLKKRIVRIMAEQAARKLDMGRKLLLCFAAMLTVALPVSLGLVHAAAGQAPAAASSHDIVGTWQGTLHIAKTDQHPQIDLRLVVKISKTDAGALNAVWYSIDQSGQSIPVATVTFQDGVLKFTITVVDRSYEGKMSADGKSIAGTWMEGTMPISMLLERATPETEWTIPPPPVKLPPMAASADPSFEVATIKPSKPDQPGKGFGVNGNHFMTRNTSLTDLITFAYGVQQKQVVDQPSWMDTDKWDIEAQPDVEGAPNKNQLMTMVKKLLADRFQLKFHKDTKELSAYVLTVAKSGNKMSAGSTDPNQLPGLFFQRVGSPTVLGVQNATMVDFAELMQSAVLDRPVVDQTALPGKWNFQLKWTADESQFGGLGVKIPPPTDAADAPPLLFTAIQEQLGLKLDAGKTQVPVLVIDKAEKPSAN